MVWGERMYTGQNFWLKPHMDLPSYDQLLANRLKIYFTKYRNSSQ